MTDGATRDEGGFRSRMPSAIAVVTAYRLHRTETAGNTKEDGDRRLLDAIGEEIDDLFSDGVGPGVAPLVNIIDLAISYAAHAGGTTEDAAWAMISNAALGH